MTEPENEDGDYNTLPHRIDNAAGIFGKKPADRVRKACFEFDITTIEELARFRTSDFIALPAFGAHALAILRYILAEVGLHLADEPPLPRLTLAALDIEVIRDRLFLRLGQASRDGRAVNLSANEVFVLVTVLEAQSETLVQPYKT